MPSGKWRPCCLCRNVLTGTGARVRLPQCQWINCVEYKWLYHIGNYCLQTNTTQNHVHVSCAILYICAPGALAPEWRLKCHQLTGTTTKPVKTRMLKWQLIWNSSKQKIHFNYLSLKQLWVFKYVSCRTYKRQTPSVAPATVSLTSNPKIWWRDKETLPRDDVIKWKHFPRYWHSVRGIHRWPVNSPHKGQWHGAWCFLWPASQQTVG